MILGKYQISPAGTRKVEANPIRGERSFADAILFRFISNQDWNLIIAYMGFRFASTDIRVLEYSEKTPEILHRTTHGLRMSVRHFRNVEFSWVEMSQARVTNPERPLRSNLMRATKKQLDEGAGLDVEEFFKKMNCLFGTREYILRDPKRRKKHFCVNFPSKEIEIAAAAFSIIRILPLLNFKNISPDPSRNDYEETWE